jgi:2-phospho-L-lactate guanylyltransferase (CobY/MobA/RfbA family)
MSKFVDFKIHLDGELEGSTYEVSIEAKSFLKKVSIIRSGNLFKICLGVVEMSIDVELTADLIGILFEMSDDALKKKIFQEWYFKST